MKGLLSGLVVVLVCSICFAQPPDSSWSRGYVPGSSGMSVDLVAGHGGGYIIGGMVYTPGGDPGDSIASGSEDFSIIRVNPSGTVLWSRTLGTQWEDYLYRLRSTADDGAIAMGTSEVDWGSSRCGIVYRLNAAGITLWTHNYGTGEYGELKDGFQTADGGFIFAGFKYVAATNRMSYALFRTDSNGNQLWSRAYGKTQYNWASSVLPTSDGGYFVTGISLNTAGNAYQPWIVRVDANGDSLWSQEIPVNGSAEVYSACLSAEGGLVIGGSLMQPNTADVNSFILKANPNGQQVWLANINQSNQTQDFVQDVSPTVDGSYVVTGFVRPVNSWEDVSHAWLFKINRDGQIVWNRIFGGVQTTGSSVKQTPDRGYVLAGGIDVGGSGLTWLCKMDPDNSLPVELTVFTARAEADVIRLNFSLASENSINHFEIWRSTSADGEYSRIASLASQGNSSSEHRYEYVDDHAEAGQTYWYYLVDVDLAGTRTEHRDFLRSATVSPEVIVPAEYAISAYPNPFNPSTTLSFTLKESGQTRVVLYDMTGRVVRELLNAYSTSGEHHLIVNAAELPSGVYYARMETPGVVKMQKLLLLK